MSVDPLQYLSPDGVLALLGGIYLLMSIVAGVHVVLNKQNEASAFSWLGIIVLAPLVGAVLYWLFGINRIRRRALAELSEHSIADESRHEQCVDLTNPLTPTHWQRLMKLGLGIHDAPYLMSNRVEALINGDQAYPQMLQAIDEAKHSVVLSSYIFEHDAAGIQFVDALAAAHDRGVQVRVLIDGVGVTYGFSTLRSDIVLRRRGVKTARFLSAFSKSGTRFINLRNHRKILVVDGDVAFIGGMNIRMGNLLRETSQGRVKHQTQDVHFKVQGPVINQINAVFEADWLFAAHETLALPRWQNKDSGGALVSRILVDGPDDNYQKLQLTMLGAIQAARHRIQIVSPYFLPGPLLFSGLQLAVLRGVRVDVCVPEKNNMAFVGWAMKANQRRLLQQGVHLYESVSPFDHSKLFLVDDYWSMIGSSNWDARSLELNFEINLECYDESLNQSLSEIISNKLKSAQKIHEYAEQDFLRRLRNNFFRMFSPYL
ncbi:MAG: cardiolipin synthase [Granulosicoccus sp.]|jgi:cardiolipin synthase